VRGGWHLACFAAWVIWSDCRRWLAAGSRSLSNQP